MGVEPLRLWPGNLSVIPAAHSTDLCPLHAQVPRAHLSSPPPASPGGTTWPDFLFLQQKQTGSARIKTYRAQRRKSSKETQKAPIQRRTLEEIRGASLVAIPPILPQTEKFQSPQTKTVLAGNGH